MMPVTRNLARTNHPASDLDGPGFYALSQGQPSEAASRLLEELLALGRLPDETPKIHAGSRKAVRVASAMIGLDAASREDASLVDLCKAFTCASSRWAHRTRAGVALVAAIRLLRILDAPEVSFEWPPSDEAVAPALGAVDCERRSVHSLLANRCGRVVVVTHDNYDEDAYLLANADVRAALQPGGMAVGFDHFRIFGHAERRTMRVFRTDKS